MNTPQTASENPEYIFLDDWNIERLQDAVKKHVADGWQMQGGIATAFDSRDDMLHTVAMVKRPATVPKYLYAAEETIPKLLDLIHAQKVDGYELLGPIVPFSHQGEISYTATMVRRIPE